jgi:serine protease AprX
MGDAPSSVPTYGAPERSDCGTSPNLSAMRLRARRGRNGKKMKTARGDGRRINNLATTTLRDEGQLRSLWARGGRGLLAATLGCAALALPLAASADDGAGSGGSAPDTHVAPELLDQGRATPTRVVRVIVQSGSGLQVAKKAFEKTEAIAGIMLEHALESADDAQEAAADFEQEASEAADAAAGVASDPAQEQKEADDAAAEAEEEAAEAAQAAESGSFDAADEQREAEQAAAEAKQEAAEAAEAATGLPSDPAEEQHECDVAMQTAEAEAQEAGEAKHASSQWAASIEGSLIQELSVVEAVAVKVPAGRIDELATTPGLVLTPDARVQVAAAPFSSGQLWPHVTGNSKLWIDDASTYAASTPTIAIVDSGIQPRRGDFGNRIVADVKLAGEGPGDSRGHGTFVAGIAAGAAEGVAGAAPAARIFSIDVMDANGMAHASDVIAACDVILREKDAYNIRVANFSLHSVNPSSVRWDPLAQAVERLWFSGVVVVAAAGNYRTGGGPSGVPYAPGSDPFVITVGAGDLSPESDPSVAPWQPPSVHSTAPWSAYGYTLDGFAKPDLVAPGRHIVGPVPPWSTLASERRDHLVSPGYMQLSGTSFAAPVVSGTVAQMLARNPSLTPDQVKGALMLTARPVGGAPQGSAGVGQVTASRAAYVQAPPDPNAALHRFVIPDPAGSPIPIFDTGAWSDAASGSPAWSSAAWADAAWSSASWSSAAWADASWASVAWNSAAWADAAWADAAWADTAREDGASSDEVAGDTEATPEQQAAIDSDPDLARPEGPEPAPGNWFRFTSNE